MALVCILCELLVTVVLILVKKSVHSRNQPIALLLMLVWSYYFTTTFPLMQPINASNSGLYFVLVMALCGFFCCEILVMDLCTPYVS